MRHITRLSGEPIKIDSVLPMDPMKVTVNLIKMPQKEFSY